MYKEIVFAAITFLATSITGGVAIDVLSAVIAYTSARLFWYYFGEKIKSRINRIRNKF